MYRLLPKVQRRWKKFDIGFIYFTEMYGRIDIRPFFLQLSIKKRCKMDNINNLLKMVEILKEKSSNISKTNIDFNIFRVLRQESDEVNLHSKFIIELLSNIPLY